MSVDQNALFAIVHDGFFFRLQSDDERFVLSKQRSFIHRFHIPAIRTVDYYCRATHESAISSKPPTIRNSVNFSQNQLTKTSTLSTVVLNSNANKTVGIVSNANIPRTPEDKSKASSEDPSDSKAETDLIKDEISVNSLLEQEEEQAVIDVPELHHGPHYELDWEFIDKDTIRVTFDLYSIPSSLVENNIYSDKNERKYSLLALMASMPTRPLKSITSLQYFVFIIRPYHKNREIVLKMEKLSIKNTSTNPYPHFSNALSLTALNHHEKYSVCISYYQSNVSVKVPDLLLCQDVINDYAKFAELRTDAKHGLLFITTQYSIILALLVVLQSVFTLRKRRIAQTVARQIAATANTIRSTLSSVSLVRQSFSSLDAANEQQHHQNNSSNQIVQREPTVTEETKLKKRIISSPAIVLCEPSISTENDPTSMDENEPFLKRVPSKNHVHFLLGPNEEDEDTINDDVSSNQPPTTTSVEPYSDQSDALLSMAHILDTNKPWSRHGQQTSPV
ncbi:unnamed protein product [Adineta ricciae]|uniref:Uncharacterized protein n=1 Tax=Adineta ricciae TaxID=249248 RepID=A0A815L9N9_ADIRI|nr:unnamed protein product [Adineta ricciae]